MTTTPTPRGNACPSRRRPRRHDIAGAPHQALGRVAQTQAQAVVGRRVGGAGNIFYTTSDPKMLTDYRPFIERWNAMTGGR